MRGEPDVTQVSAGRCLHKQWRRLGVFCNISDNGNHATTIVLVLNPYGRFYYCNCYCYYYYYYYYDYYYYYYYYYYNYYYNYYYY